MLKKSKSDELLHALETRAREMKPNDRFPSVRQLMKEYGVSQFTVGLALVQLEEFGIIRREVGRGTFVAQPHQVVPKRIAVVYPEWPSAAIHDMTKAVEQKVLESQWICHKISYEVGSDIFSRLASIDADAIIFDPPDPGHITPRQLHILTQCPVPVVMVRTDISISYVNCVCGNNSASGILAANYLMSKGHRRIGILLSEPHVNTVKELSSSFCNSVRAGGGALTIIDCKISPGEDSLRSAYINLKKWLNENPLCFTALAVISDETALSAYKALAEHNISIPEHLSVMGFGNASTSEFYHPSLTTVNMDRNEMAREALKIVVDQMSCRKSPGINHKVFPNIVERESVSKIK